MTSGRQLLTAKTGAAIFRVIRGFKSYLALSPPVGPIHWRRIQMPGI